MLRKRLWFSMTVLLLSLLATSFVVWRLSFYFSADRLLKQAYFEQRPLELRISWTPRSSVRMQRGQEISRMDRPQSLLEAETAIAAGLRKNPGDGALLAVRGQANLLEWSYEAAITDLEQALDKQPRSAGVLNSLAAAYYERAQAENRFDDYSTAFELQSRALLQSPDDTIILFNRAITASRLYLFKQSMEDWQRYLSLDAAGDWSEEARRNFDDVKATVEEHDKRTKSALLTPAEFARTVDPADSKTWATVEPRIEEYFSAAITDWLPSAFPVDAKTAAPLDVRRALMTLAAVLSNNHGDAWLEDLLSASGSDEFSKAVDALGAAVRADNADYTLGRKEAAKAELLFSQARNVAGELRARYEEIYALRLSDASPECLDKLNNLAPLIQRSQYRRLEIQLKLERRNCSLEEGNLQATDQLDKAYESARSAHYQALQIRISSFLAFDDFLKGKHRIGLAHYRDGIQQYWSSSVASYLGRALYSAAGFGYAESSLWHLAKATDEQDIALAAPEEDPLSLAVEHTELAQASLMAQEPAAAKRDLQIAQRLLASAPQTEATENYRLTVESYSALVDGESGHPEVGLARLDRTRPQLSRIANTKVVADFHFIDGELHSLAGNPQAAEEELTTAVAIGEKMRRSLRSESDQVSWMREWARPYLDLVEVEFRLGKSADALNVWELYRDANSKRASGTAATSPAIDANAATNSTREALAQEYERVRLTFSQLDTQTALIVGLTPHGVAIWTYDERGVTARWLQKDPAELRLQVQRLAEQCAKPSSSLDELRGTARQLHEALIEPVSDQFRPNQTLVIQADDVLSVIPFQVLVDRDGQYLEDEHPVAYMPVLNDLDAVRRGVAPITAGAAALVVASSEGSSDGLKSLPEVITEAQAVLSHFPHGQVLVGAQASFTALGSQLPQAEIFHFAGHAVGGRGRSGLLIGSQDNLGHPALFDANALRKIPAPRLRMVVLSACSTENGAEGLAGDFDSLARVFLIQGVPHVLASRWNVDSASALMLMAAFYDKLLAGASVPQALAGAEYALRQRAPHPYYWAGFDSLGQN
jgi:CHAT domain-containing protein